MTAGPAQVEECVAPGPEAILAAIAGRDQPLVFRAGARHWPLTQQGLDSDQAALSYLSGFAAQPVAVCELPPEAKGRVFFNGQMDGFNFRGYRQHFAELAERLAGGDLAAGLYMGSTETTQFFPGFAEQHGQDFAALGALTSLWVGNASRIAAHFDFPHNLACNLVGQRTFTLFPPQEVGNLYVGPLGLAPGGQDISLVNFDEPDFDRFPKAAEALAAAQQATLEPGDILFIPSLWWHQVVAKASLNVLMTFWWRDSPAWLGRPTNALLHAVLSLRDLPKAQRQAWKALFDHYVFDHDGAPAHLPEQAQGPLASPMTEQAARLLRAELMAKFKR
ncbi:cupin-like domain-containing protein [Gallaecimonas pentaromativorans]|uniref:cupin-like domain-containing protein n=1 Tax=Gallaecimonas pentaromativorans TaxID=584787 RepID=UPI003A93CD7F